MVEQSNEVHNSDEEIDYTHMEPEPPSTPMPRIPKHARGNGRPNGGGPPLNRKKPIKKPGKRGSRRP